MKKFLLSFGLVVVFAFYVMLSSSRSANQPLAMVSNVPITSTVPIQIPSPSPIVSKPTAIPATTAATSNSVSVKSAPKSTPSISPNPSPVVPAANVGLYKDGTYTSPVVDAYYGNVQIAINVSGGRLTDVSFLQYPSDRRTSQQINSRAMPALKSEAIAAQSAKVDMVSGATATSQAFAQSLSTVLAQAAN